MTKISFPEHMRRMEAALDVLAAECKKYDPEKRDWQIVITREFAGEVQSDISIEAYPITSFKEFPNGATTTSFGSPVSNHNIYDSAGDCAIDLLHYIAGTEPAPF